MLFHFFIAYRCHPEHIRCTQCKLREGSGARGDEMLRCAQHDKAALNMTGLDLNCHTVRPNIDQACSQCCERSTARFQSA